MIIIKKEKEEDTDKSSETLQKESKQNFNDYSRLLKSVTSLFDGVDKFSGDSQSVSEKRTTFRQWTNDVAEATDLLKVEALDFTARDIPHYEPHCIYI